MGWYQLLLLKCKSLCRIASVCLFVLSVNFAVRPSGEGTCCRTNQRFSLRLKPDMPPSRFLKNNSIRILVDLVIVELYVVSLFQNKQETKINQTNPRHVIYICICLSPPGVDVPFPLNYSDISHMLNVHQDSLASSLAWFCAYKLGLKVS